MCFSRVRAKSRSTTDILWLIAATPGTEGLGRRDTGPFHTALFKEALLKKPLPSYLPVFFYYWTHLQITVSWLRVRVKAWTYLLSWEAQLWSKRSSFFMKTNSSRSWPARNSGLGRIWTLKSFLVHMHVTQLDENNTNRAAPEWPEPVTQTLRWVPYSPGCRLLPNKPLNRTVCGENALMCSQFLPDCGTAHPLSL